MILEWLGQIYYFVLRVIWYWWWVPMPFYLQYKLYDYYNFWSWNEFWGLGNFRKNFIVLEIIPPKNLAKTFRTMEDFYSGIWGMLYTPANWREHWLEGMPTHYGGPGWFALEIATIAGKVHFYARIPKSFRGVFESNLYAQYPDAEISQVEDYTKEIPWDAPNDTWDLKGEDYRLLKDDPLPLKTYSQFFEPKMGKIDEQRLIDPIHSLLEAMSSVKSGDRLWIQFGLIPFGNEIKYAEYAERVKNKYAKRKEKEEATKGFKLKDLIDPILAVLGKVAEPTPFRSAASQALGGPAMVYVPPKPDEKKEEKEDKTLTPGERELLEAIEEKIAKRSYLCWIRTIHLFNKTLPHDSGTWGITRTYFQHFAGFNSILFWGQTRTKIQYILRPRRLYIRKRKIYKSYRYCLPPRPDFKYIRSKDIKFGPLFVLNIEELATLYHFPNQLDAPRMYQVGPKKAEPPTNLPME